MKRILLILALLVLPFAAGAQTAPQFDYEAGGCEGTTGGSDAGRCAATDDWVSASANKIADWIDQLMGGRNPGKMAAPNDDRRLSMTAFAADFDGNEATDETGQGVVSNIGPGSSSIVCEGVCDLHDQIEEAIARTCYNHGTGGGSISSCEIILPPHDAGNEFEVDSTLMIWGCDDDNNDGNCDNLTGRTTDGTIATKAFDITIRSAKPLNMSVNQGSSIGPKTCRGGTGIRWMGTSAEPMWVAHALNSSNIGRGVCLILDGEGDGVAGAAVPASHGVWLTADSSEGEVSKGVTIEKLVCSSTSDNFTAFNGWSGQCIQSGNRNSNRQEQVDNIVLRDLQLVGHNGVALANQGVGGTIAENVHVVHAGVGFDLEVQDLTIIGGTLATIPQSGRTGAEAIACDNTVASLRVGSSLDVALEQPWNFVQIGGRWEPDCGNVVTTVMPATDTSFARFTSATWLGTFFSFGDDDGATYPVHWNQYGVFNFNGIVGLRGGAVPDNHYFRFDTPVGGTVRYNIQAANLGDFKEGTFQIGRASRARAFPSVSFDNVDTGSVLPDRTDLGGQPQCVKFFGNAAEGSVGGGFAFGDCTETAGGIENVVEDTSPQLGGNLDVNGNEIVSVGGGDIVVRPDTSGDVIIISDTWAVNTAGEATFTRVTVVPQDGGNAQLLEGNTIPLTVSPTGNQVLLYTKTDGQMYIEHETRGEKRILDEDDILGGGGTPDHSECFPIWAPEATNGIPAGTISMVWRAPAAVTVTGANCLMGTGETINLTVTKSGGGNMINQSACNDTGPNLTIANGTLSDLETISLVLDTPGGTPRNFSMCMEYTYD